MMEFVGASLMKLLKKFLFSQKQVASELLKFYWTTSTFNFINILSKSFVKIKIFTSLYFIDVILYDN